MSPPDHGFIFIFFYIVCCFWCDFVDGKNYLSARVMEKQGFIERIYSAVQCKYIWYGIQ